MTLETMLAYLVIPTISAVVGYTTNWLAVKMTFYPIERKGLGPFGWQGIIPANARKMATIAVDMCIRKLITLDDLVQRIDADEMYRAAKHHLERSLEEIVDDLLNEYEPAGLGGIPLPNVWHMLPLRTKEMVYGEIRKEMPRFAREFVAEMKENLPDLIDLNQVVIDRLTEKKALLNDIFLLGAKKEFEFLARSGVYFGFPMGIVVMFLWFYAPTWWLLPLCGAIVGGVTNKLAIYLIGKPLHPKKLGSFTILGMFIKRQKEVSKIYGHVYATKLVNSGVLFEGLMRSAASDRLFDILQRNVNKGLERAQGNLKPLMVLAIGTDEYIRMKGRICDRFFAEMQHQPREVFAYADKALDIENTLSEKVAAMSPEDFYDLLHPTIEKDEWKIVAVGAALGCLAGYLQWLTLT